MFRLRLRTRSGRRRHRLLGVATVVSLLAGATPAQAAPSVYVTNSDHVTVSQYGIDAGGLLSPLVPPTARARDFPNAVAVSPDRKSAYVTNGGRGDYVAQYNVASGGQLSPKNPATVMVGGGGGVGPFGIALNPGRDSAYVTSSAGISQFNVGPTGKLTPKNPARLAVGSTADCGGEPGWRERVRRRLLSKRRFAVQCWPGWEAQPEEPRQSGRRHPPVGGGGES